jgi:hypothetical protein
MSGGPNEERALAREDRERIRWFAEQHKRNGRPIPGWSVRSAAG